MLKLIKNIGCLTIIGVIVAIAWTVYRSMEDRQPLTSEQKAGQAEMQRKQAVDIRVVELEQTQGKGRVRMSKETENAARLIYNSRHPDNALPLL